MQLYLLHKQSHAQASTIAAERHANRRGGGGSRLGLVLDSTMHSVSQKISQ